MFMRRAVEQKPVQMMATPAKFPAPIGGWIQNQNIGAPTPGPQGAIVLENIFPTAIGGEIRRGSALYATLGLGDSDMTSMFTYNFGNNKHFFASTATTVYDITSVSQPENIILVDDLGNIIVDDFGEPIGQLSTEGLEVLEGMTNGNWIDAQFGTTGGNYLIIVNGEDPMQIFDGTRWYVITDENVNQLNYDAETSPFTVGATITGGTSGATAVISQVIDNGVTGSLIIGDVTGGPFQDNEIITGGGGSATVDGAVTVLFTGITGTRPDGTPLETSDFSYVWSYKERLFFILKNSLTAYFLDIDAIGGVAKILPLGGEFSLGGTLFIGAQWSLSAGDGLVESCIFMTDEGEVSVYNGINPLDAATWSKNGRYQIGKPRGPKSFIRAGGDLIFATSIGFVPLSQAVQIDFSVLAGSAVSYPIETAWNQAVDLRSGASWDCIIWPEKQMVVVSLPTVNEQPASMLVTNARTGAWANFTGWSGTCLEIFEGRLFFGSQNGRVVEAYVTGQDEGATYTATYVPLFADFGDSGAQKIGAMARVQTRGPFKIAPQISTMENWVVNLPASPSATAIPVSNQWGVGIWGTSTWGAAQSKTWQGDWFSVGGIGYALAPCVQITSGSLIPIDAEIIAVDFSYTLAGWGS